MVKAGRKPELIVIAGPNGSGKTSVTQKFLHHEWADDTVYINPDQIANDKFGDWNSREAVLQAANYCAEWREQCLRDKVSFVFETVFSAEDKIDFLVRAKEAGFFIRVFFISTSHPSINASRIAKRVMEGGHDVPIRKIISRYTKSIINCEAIASLVDRLYVYDNSVNDRCLVRKSVDRQIQHFSVKCVKKTKNSGTNPRFRQSMPGTAVEKVSVRLTRNTILRSGHCLQ